MRDIRACAEYVIDAGIAAPGRIGIMGGSYGGYMTMAGLVEYPELFAAGANLYGVVNFETFFAQTEPWMAAISAIEYGDPRTEVELLRRLSPIHRIERVRAPTIVLHGANDTNVPVVEAEQVVADLQRRKVPVEYVLFPDDVGRTPMRGTVSSKHPIVSVLRWRSRAGSCNTWHASTTVSLNPQRGRDDHAKCSRVPTLDCTKACGMVRMISWVAFQPVQCPGTTTDGPTAANSATVRGIIGSNRPPVRCKPGLCRSGSAPACARLDRYQSLKPFDLEQLLSLVHQPLAARAGNY